MSKSRAPLTELQKILLVNGGTYHSRLRKGRAAGDIGAGGKPRSSENKSKKRRKAQEAS